MLSAARRLALAAPSRRVLFALCVARSARFASSSFLLTSNSQSSTSSVSRMATTSTAAAASSSGLSSSPKGASSPVASSTSDSTSGSEAATAVYSPQSVLDFWFGGAWGKDEELNQKSYMGKMMPLWFGAKFGPNGFESIGPEAAKAIDQKCYPFVDTIRTLGRGELNGEEWQTVDGLYAQIILADQLARNCFRGSAEAFAYADQAQAAARKIFDMGAYKKWNSLHYFTFLCCVGEHSEDIADHEMNKVCVHELLVALLQATALSQLIHLWLAWRGVGNRLCWKW